MMPAVPPASIKAVVTANCPQCGAQTLFKGPVRFAERGRARGLEFESFNVGDGPAAILIFLVGTIMVVGALVVDGMFAPLWWVHLVWIPVATALTLRGLRILKARLLTQEYRQRAHEVRIVK